MVVRKGQEGETRGTVGGKIRTRRKKPGEQWWKEKDRKEETRGTVSVRKGQEGRN